MPSIYLALIIPLIVTGVFYYFKRHEFVWWEFFVPFLVALVAIVISKLVIDSSSVTFKEYWGSTITEVYEEEPYNYWHHETCSRQVYTGTDSKGHAQYRTEYYDCSHQDDVGPSWYAKTNIGETISISENDHDKLVSQFKTMKIEIESRSNYAPRDRCVGSRGTKFEGKAVGKISYIYRTKWNGSDETRKTYTSQHSYENRIKASDLTIFNISLVTDEMADSLGLYKYPKYTDGLEFPTILGGNVSNETQEKFKRLNGKFGPKSQVRLWILVFENKPMSIAQYQENYWVKGNKNELVICIGKKGNEIQWSHAFSWALSSELTIEAQNKVLELVTYRDSVVKVQLPPAIPINKTMKKKVLGKSGEKLPDVLPLPKQVMSDSIIKIKNPIPVLNEQTWDEYYKYLDNNLNRFQRRSFEEFSYIDVEPSMGWVIFVYILVTVISVGVCLIVVNNEIKDDSTNFTGNYHKNYYQ